MTICFTSNFLLDDSQKGPKSHLEILAEMRDYKRRRQSYRAKNVHITKKSYTEVRSENKEGVFAQKGLLSISINNDIPFQTKKMSLSLLLVPCLNRVANYRGVFFFGLSQQVPNNRSISDYEILNVKMPARYS